MRHYERLQHGQAATAHWWHWLTDHPVAQALGALIGAGVGYLYGTDLALLQVLVVFSLFDWLTGFAAAAKRGELSATEAGEGAVRKAIMAMLVGISHLIDVQLGTATATVNLMTLVLWAFIAREGLSIIENADELGVGVPPALRDAMRNLESRGSGREQNE